MRREEILQRLQAEPFQPFRIHLTNGTVHIIRHPEMAMVTAHGVVIGVPKANTAGSLLEDYLAVSLLHVAQIDTLIETTPQQSSTN
jgi:hypothetical protein